jgi:DNA mismatch repair protein Mlh1 C-terminus
MCLLYDVHVLTSAQRNSHIYNTIQQALPMFLLRLATDVDWMEEQPCFAGIATELRCVLHMHIAHTVIYTCTCRADAHCGI